MVLHITTVLTPAVGGTPCPTQLKLAVILSVGLVEYTTESGKQLTNLHSQIVGFGYD